VQSYEDYLDVGLAYIDAVRRRVAPTPPGTPKEDGTIAKQQAVQPQAAEQLRGAFSAVSTMLAGYFPDHVDRALRYVMYIIYLHGPEAGTQIHILYVYVSGFGCRPGGPAASLHCKDIHHNVGHHLQKPHQSIFWLTMIKPLSIAECKQESPYDHS
jgi:hypothetical protein